LQHRACHLFSRTRVVGVGAGKRACDIAGAGARYAVVAVPFDAPVVAGQGNSERLGELAAEFLDDLATKLPPDLQNACCDMSANYYLVLFTATDIQGKPSLVHVLVHRPSTKGLPGLTGTSHPLYEVFLTEDASVQINGWFEIERTENPAAKQLGDFIAAVLPKVIRQYRRVCIGSRESRGVGYRGSQGRTVYKLCSATLGRIAVLSREAHEQACSGD
jgi:hypothetical protein